MNDASSSDILSDNESDNESNNNNPNMNDMPNKNLLYNLFTFRQPYKYENFSKTIKNNLASTQILVILHPEVSLWGSLSSLKHMRFIQHNCKQVANLAPTLEQYYQQFKVYRKNLQTQKHKKIIELEPTEDFFKQININFRFANNASYHKQKNSSKPPIYWCYFEPTTNQLVKLDMLRAKIIYCKKYTEQILKYKPARIAFFTLLDEFKTTNSSIEIVSYGVNTEYTSFQSLTEFENFFINDAIDFPDCYVLMELLLNYPNINSCIWNRIELTATNLSL